MKTGSESLGTYERVAKSILALQYHEQPVEELEKLFGPNFRDGGLMKDDENIPILEGDWIVEENNTLEIYTDGGFQKVFKKVLRA